MENKIKEIWDNFDNSLRSFICTRMNNNDECHDVLQEVYLKIIKNIERINKVENVPFYLNKLAQNAIADYYRQQNKKPLLGNIDFNKVIIIDEIKEEASNNCCRECLEPGIDTLPQKYKEALIMSELEGLPQKKVAEKLGITLSGAKSRVQRAREKLKAEVIKCCYNNFK